MEMSQMQEFPESHEEDRYMETTFDTDCAFETIRI